jgi:hypothetical protein
VGYHSTGGEVSSISSRPTASDFRFAGSIIIILILIAIFLNAIDSVNQRVSSMAHDRVIEELNIALSFKLYQAAIEGKMSELPKWHQANPFKVLAGKNYKPPQDYVGNVLADSDLKQAGWYFNLKTKAIYFWDEVRLTQSYQLQLIYRDLNQTEHFEAVADKIKRLEIVALK